MLGEWSDKTPSVFYPFWFFDNFSGDRNVSDTFEVSDTCFMPF